MDAAFFEHVEGPVRPALRGVLRGLGGFREQAPAPVARRELPGALVPFILTLDHGWKLDNALQPDGRWGSFTAGLGFEGPTSSEHEGRAFALQFDLTPLGAYAFLGVPLGELAGRIVALEDVLGAEAPLLVERLACLEGWPARFEVVQDALEHRLARVRRPPSPDVVWAVGQLERSDGRVAVGALVGRLGCSRRHLARRFAEEVGLTPKAYGRLVRFDRTAERLRTDPTTPLADLAVAGGYYDQAHMTREVSAFAGLPPGALQAASLGPGAGFAL